MLSLCIYECCELVMMMKMMSMLATMLMCQRCCLRSCCGRTDSDTLQTQHKQTPTQRYDVCWFQRKLANCKRPSIASRGSASHAQQSLWILKRPLVFWPTNQSRSLDFKSVLHNVSNKSGSKYALDDRHLQCRLQAMNEHKEKRGGNGLTVMTAQNRSVFVDFREVEHWILGLELWNIGPPTGQRKSRGVASRCSIL